VRVNGQPIALEAVSSGSEAGQPSPRAKVDSAIDRHLAAEEALRRGLGKASSDAPASLRDEEQLRDALFASMRDSLALTDDELRTHYEATKTRFVRRQWRLLRKGFATEAAARAEDRRLGATGRLDAATAETIGPLPQDALPASVVPEALSFTAPGQRAAVLRAGSWSLVELEEVRTEPLSYGAVRPQVEASLRLVRAQTEFDAELAHLRSEARIEIDPAALAAAAR